MLNQKKNCKTWFVKVVKNPYISLKIYETKTITKTKSILLIKVVISLSLSKSSETDRV